MGQERVGSGAGIAAPGPAPAPGTDGGAHDKGSVFVGRERELHELASGLEDALSGRGQLFLISGEPGIGKSRVAEKFALAARERGAQILRGRCWEGAGAPAYWPWVQCLRSYLRAHDAATVRDHMGSGATDVAQMLPELHDLFPELPPPPSTDPESARFRLFDSTATCLRNAGGAQALVIVIDDLQAADTASLLLLRFLATQIAETRILVLATYRDIELTPEHPLTDSVSELVREPTTHHLALRGLEKPDVALLIQRTARVTPTAALTSALHRQTNGNPLFVGETIRLLAAEGHLESAAEAASLRIAIPGAVRDVILRRLGHLDERCLTTLMLSSVLGPEVDTEALRLLSDLSADEFPEALDEAVQSGLFVEIAGVPGRLRFSHDLVRETLYGGITPTRRTRLHLRAGEILEELYAADLDRYLDEIAYHFFEAAPAGEARKAAGYAQRAGDHAARSLAYEEAARLYRMALQALELAGTGDDLERGELLLQLGDAQMRAGDTSGAKETFLRVAGIARRRGTPEHLARAALGYGGRFVWARAANDEEVIPLLEDALRVVGEGDSVLRARVLARLAGALRDQPGLEPRASLSREAVEIARRLGDPATLAYALDGRYSAIWAPDTDDERLRIADEIVQIAELTGDMERAFQGHHYRLAVFMERGDIPAVRAELKGNARLADELRQPAQRWYVRATVAILSLLEGGFEDAERLIDEAFEQGRQAESMHAVGVVRLQQYGLRREQGRATELEEVLRRSVDEYSFWPWMRCALLHLYVEADRKAEALSLLEAVAAHDFRDLPWDNDWLMGMSLLAEVVAHLPDPERASSVYELLRPYADRNGFGHPEFCTGSISRPLGLLAGVMSRWEDAERHFERALEMNERMGARPWVAHTRRDYAAMLLSRDGPGDRERAHDLLREALDTARALGMVALEDKITEVLADSTPTPAPSGAPRSVFRREGEYWSVAFGGEAFRLRDAKGLRHLARLLASPGTELHVLDLVRMEEGHAEASGTAEAGLVVGGLGDAGEVLDPEAKAAYKERLRELNEELEEAEAWNDSERAARATEEVDFLTRELAGAVGMGGRDRRAASAAERARVNVTRAIKAALARIAEHSPALGEHLDSTVHTGTFCSYTPDARAPVSWQL